jgi:hypothetical protein
MLTAWLGGLGTKLTETWAGRALSPASLFWLGGLSALLLGPGGDRRRSDFEATFNGAPLALQVVALVAAAALIAASEQVSKGLALGVTRLLEGYWPRLASRPRGFLVGRVVAARDRDHDRWVALNIEIAKETDEGLSEEDRLKYNDVERLLHRVPLESGVMPTRFGNVMRAAEIRIAGRYGLDPVRCWPTFWLLLPELARTEIADARAAVDARTQAWFWAALFCLWTPLLCLAMPITWWWPWPMLLIGLSIATIVYYGWLLPAATTYSELLDTVFGLYRGELYKAFDQPMPADPDRQRAEGESLTALIWRGQLGAPAKKATRHKNKKTPLTASNG